jgi:methionyl-tRNA formyltransferase
LKTNGGKKNILMLKFWASGGPELRIVFMGSPRFSVPALEQLVNGNYEIAAVYTQPDKPAGRGKALAASPVKEAAIKLGLKVVQPENFRSPESIARLKEFKPDVIVVCAYGQILTQDVLDIPPYQCINVHFSLLPRHRGASPVASAILAGDEFTGVSIQLVRKKLDTGPLLASAAVPVSPADNTETLMEKLSVVGAYLLEEALNGWLRGEITPLPQDEAGANYFFQIKKEDGEIDWTQPAVDIWRRIRAFYPWPGCFTAWNGRQLKINKAVVLSGEKTGEAGRVISVPGNGEKLGIITGDGILGVLELQLEGKRAMTAADFMRGQRNFLGTKLPS